jgi:hypothetical protein
MKTLRILLTAFALAAGVAACGAPPIMAPDAPRFDGVQTIGGGKDATSTSTTGTPTETPEDAERGGPFTVGSGN